MKKKTKHEQVKQAIVEIFQQTEQELTTEELVRRISNREIYEDATAETVKKAVTRANRSLMEDYPDTYGFYLEGNPIFEDDPFSKDDPVFYTLSPGERYDEGMNYIFKHNRRYAMRQGVGIESFEQAMYELVKGHLGQNEIKKLLVGVGSSKNLSLKSDNQIFYDLQTRIEITPRYQPLYPPKVEEKSFADIVTALIHEVSFSASYLRGDKEEYWPVRLVVQGNVIYVLCKTRQHAEEYQEYPIHRFTDVSHGLNDVTEQGLRQLQKTSLNLSYEKETVKKTWRRPIETTDKNSLIKELELKFYGNPAQHMSEVRFHLNERMADDTTSRIEVKPAKPGEKTDYCHIKARNIVDDYNLRTWLLGFGSQVEVVKPKYLRNEIIEQFQLAFNRYSK